MNKPNENKYIILDRDGVIVKDKGHTYKIEDMEILPHAIEGLKKMKNLGFKFVIATNQAGIAKGFYKHKDADLFNEELRKHLNKNGIMIEAVYLCPHHPNHTGNCLCRKPGIGMIEKAAKDFSISKEFSVIIGDKDSDIEAGRNWGCKTLRIVNADYPEGTPADYRAKDLIEAAEILKRELFSQLPHK